MKKNDGGIVRFELDPVNLPSLSEVQKAELVALAATPDDDIDHKVAASLFDEFQQNAQRGRVPVGEALGACLAFWGSIAYIRNAYRLNEGFEPCPAPRLTTASA